VPQVLLWLGWVHSRGVPAGQTAATVATDISKHDAAITASDHAASFICFWFVNREGITSVLGREGISGSGLGNFAADLEGCRERENRERS
jgi:hypothetical protein